MHQLKTILKRFYLRQKKNGCCRAEQYNDNRPSTTTSLIWHAAKRLHGCILRKPHTLTVYNTNQYYSERVTHIITIKWVNEYGMVPCWLCHQYYISWYSYAQKHYLISVLAQHDGTSATAVAAERKRMCLRVQSVKHIGQYNNIGFKIASNHIAVVVVERATSYRKISMHSALGIWTRVVCVVCVCVMCMNCVRAFIVYPEHCLRLLTVQQAHTNPHILHRGSCSCVCVCWTWKRNVTTGIGQNENHYKPSAAAAAFAIPRCLRKPS